MIGPKTTPATAALAVALLGWMPAAASAAAEEDRMDDRRTVTVSGEGRISAAPDLAEISVGVVTEAPTARDALSGNNEASTALAEELKRRGVAAKDIQTSNINLSPRYSQPQPRPGQFQGEEFTPRIVGYSVTNTVRVVARDLGKLGELLDAVVTAGANQMHGISFRVDEPEKLLDEARKRAVAEAKRKAERLAGELGMVLGSPVQVVESGGILPPPQPMMGRAMMMAAEAVPVAPGEQELSVTVQVVFELVEPE